MSERIGVVEYLGLEPEPHLIAQECTECSALYLDRRSACGRCGGVGFKPRDLQREGTVRAFTVIHRAAPGVKVPFTAVVVDLDGGGVVKANLIESTDWAPGDLAGARVSLKTFAAGRDAAGSEAVGFGFALCEAGQAAAAGASA